MCSTKMDLALKTVVGRVQALFELAVSQAWVVAAPGSLVSNREMRPLRHMKTLSVDEKIGMTRARTSHRWVLSYHIEVMEAVGNLAKEGLARVVGWDSHQILGERFAGVSGAAWVNEAARLVRHLEDHLATATAVEARPFPGYPDS